MKTAAIFLHGLPGIDKPKAVETFEYTDEGQVKERVKALQKGYCEKGDKIQFQTNKTVSPKGKEIKIFHAFSEVDFSYVAYLGMRLKVNPIK
jgi:hypothetical protein